MERVTVSETIRDIASLLDRVTRSGEEISILRDGVEVGRLVPARPSARLADVISALQDLAPVEEGFLEDLKQVQAVQEPLPPSAWDS